MNSLINKVGVSLVAVSMIGSSFAPLLALPTIAQAGGGNDATNTVVLDTINGHDGPIDGCIDGPITITGSGTTGKQGGPYHLDINWGDGSPVTTIGSPTIPSGGGDSFSFSASHTPIAASTGITLFLYHGSSSGADGSATATVSQCINGPAAAPACEEDATQTIVSDDSTVDGHGAALLSPTNSGWTASIPGASWIWSENPVADSTIDTTKTFTSTFTITGAPTGASFDIASDNTYDVSINGHSVGSSSDSDNFESSTQDHYDIPAGSLVEGTNTLTITVTNQGVPGSTPDQNPAGVMFSLTAHENDCPLPPPTPETGDLKVIKHVVGGTASASDFSISVTQNDTNVSGSPQAGSEIGTTYGDLPTGTYTVSESDAGPANYEESFSGDCNDSGDVALTSEGATCTITNTYVAPTDGGGTDNNTPPACDPTPSTPGITTFDDFNLGNVNGQFGWSSTGAYDQGVVSNIYGYPTFGCKSLRLSNAVTSGSFGDQTFSTSTVNEAGEATAVSNGMSGGVRQNHFEAQFDLGVATTTHAYQPGLVTSVSPDRGDGARMSYLRFEDQPDGTHVFFDDVTDPSHVANADTFNETDIATLDRTTAHTIKFSMDFVDGPDNDVVKIYIDGVLKATGTSWEDYYRYDSEQAGNSNVVPTTDSLLFRAGGTAAPATLGSGFLFDNMTLTSSTNEVAPPVCDPSVNLLQNPSFEAPALSSGTWSLFPTGTAGLEWIANLVGLGTPGNAEIQNNVNSPASDGNQLSELDSDASVSLSQNIPTIVGDTYNVAYDFKPRPDTDPAENKVEALYGGVLGLSTDASAGADWTSHNYTFVATTTTTSIAFQDAGTPQSDSYGTYIDNTSVTCVDVCKNIDGAQASVPAGMVINNDGFCEPAPQTATVVATKIVCNNESDLPNLAGSSHTTDVNTAADFLAAHPNTCHLEPNWQFEWGNDQQGDGGDTTIGHVAGYNTTAATDGTGTVTTEVPLAGIGSAIHMREVLQSGYVPFTYDAASTTPNGNNVSAELSCGGDGLNYDNYDYITNPQAGATYYCVAYNAPVAPTCNENATATYVSDTSTTFSGDDTTGNAVPYVLTLTPTTYWTAIIPSATWIWSTPAIADGTLNNTETFTKSFTIVGTPLDSSLTLAADNFYSVAVNGHDIDLGVGNSTDNNFTTAATYAIPAADLLSGANVLTVVVKNEGLANLTAEQNPAGLDYSLTINNNECATPPVDQVKVHIYKYLDNGETVAQIPDDSTAPEFPMQSSWNAVNLGGPGSGYYFLGDNEGGTALKYAADTSAMDVPADYSTNEMTGGDSPVVADQNSCSPGKYYFEGYKIGDSLAAAQSAALTNTVNFYGLTTDKFVIVINGECPPAPPTEHGTITIVKKTIGGDDTFKFDIDGVAESTFNTLLATTTVEGYATTSADVPVGTYDVDEQTAEGWTLSGPVCTLNGDVVTGEAEQRGQTVDVGDGQNVICTFTNTKETSGPTTGSIVINKYICPSNTSVTRANNGVGGTVPAGCVAESGADFGYVHGSQTDANSPYPELNGPFVAGGTTDLSGVLTIPNLSSDGRYLVAETNSSSQQLAAGDILGLYCSGDGDTSGSNDNQELTFVPAGGTVNCVAYNKAEPVPGCMDKNAQNFNPAATQDDGSCTYSGHIIVDKVTDPSGSEQSFHFETTGTGYNAFDLTDTATPNDQTLATGDDAVYGVSEDPTDGWTQTHVDCTSDQEQEDIDPTAITLHSSETVTCVFTNTESGRIIVNKVTDPEGSPEIFDFEANYNHGGFSLSDGENNDSGEIAPGTYSVTEATTPGWVQSDVTCSSQQHEGTINPAEIDLAAGETVNCTFTNTQPPTLTIVKNTEGGNGEFDFSVKGTEEGAVAVLPSIETVDGTGSTEPITLTPGVYNVGEFDQDGWNLTGHTCFYNNESEGNEIPDLLGGEQITVDNGDSVTCVYTNTKKGSGEETGSDLSVIKTVDDSTPNVGQNVTYTITVTNNGPQGTNDVSVTDVLPTGVSYVSDDASGDYNSSTGVWTVGNLGDGESATLHIVAKVTAEAGATIDNVAVASIGGEGSTDPDSGNNSGDASLTVNTPHHGGGGGGCVAGTHFDPTTASCVSNGGQVLGASTDGLVLGATCGLYMDQHLKIGSSKNDPDQVTKLQQFLIQYGFGTFTPSGYFGSLTEAAVKAFQQKYAADILTPWGLTSPTGLAYLTTLREINLIECPDLTIPVPTLVDWNQNPNAQ